MERMDLRLRGTAMNLQSDGCMNTRYPVFHQTEDEQAANGDVGNRTPQKLQTEKFLHGGAGSAYWAGC